MANDPVYRPSKQIPYELRSHIAIYFEEGLYSPALSLLTRLFVSPDGFSNSRNESKAVFVPGPNLLRLIATLSVHPSLTSHRKDNQAAFSSLGNNYAADESLRLLRDIKTLVGPVSAHFGAAFAFTSASDARRRRNRRQRIKEEEDRHSSDGSGEIEDDPLDHADEIKRPIAQAGSLFEKGISFWHVFGWAMICAVKHKRRWVYWRLWLDFMLDVLEDDWEEHLRRARERNTSMTGDESLREDPSLKESMIMTYLFEAARHRSGTRSLLRSIFADASPSSVSEFPPVFAKETVEEPDSDIEPKIIKPQQKKLNIEEGEFGDYFDGLDNDEDGRDDTLQAILDPLNFENGLNTTPRPMRASRIKREHTPGNSSAVKDNDAVTPKDSIDSFGGMDAIILRQRLLQLLVQTAMYLPDTFASVEDVLDLYTEFIRPLPLNIFVHFISPTVPTRLANLKSNRLGFSLVTQAALNQMLLRTLLSAAAPGYHHHVPSRKTMIRYLLPHSASTSSVENNAKVALLVESLVRMLLRSEKGESEFLSPNPLEKEAFIAAAEAGIEARRTKTAPDARNRKSANKELDAEAARWLASSEMRLRFVLGTM